MIDSHCHLDLDVFDHDREEVIKNAYDEGVVHFHVPGTTAEKWAGLLEYANQPNIDVSLGLHPYFLNKFAITDLFAQLMRLRELLHQQNQHIFAIGECGLDAIIDIDMQLQKDIFKAQIGIASDYGKPLIIHARKTHHLIAQCLNECGYQGRGIVHGFSGSVEVAQSYIERGWLLGVGGTITYPRGAKTITTLREIGLNHLVLETDSPDMPLSGYQGIRNEPKNVRLIAQQLAESFQVGINEVIATTSKNYLSLAQ